MKYLGTDGEYHFEIIDDLQFPNLEDGLNYLAKLERQLWADGEIIEDWHEDIIEPEELEHAAYEYVELYREGGEEHIRGGVAHLVESIVFTPEKLTALGLAADVLPIGWWIGLRVTDADVWSKVKSGEYSMFSIEGEAVRVKVGEESEDE